MILTSKWHILGKYPQILMSKWHILLLLSRLCLLHPPSVIDYLCNSGDPGQIGMLDHSASVTALPTYGFSNVLVLVLSLLQKFQNKDQFPLLLASPRPQIFLFGTPCPASSLGALQPTEYGPFNRPPLSVSNPVLAMVGHDVICS